MFLLAVISIGSMPPAFIQSLLRPVVMIVGGQALDQLRKVGTQIYVRRIDGFRSISFHSVVPGQYGSTGYQEAVVAAYSGVLAP